MTQVSARMHAGHHQAMEIDLQLWSLSLSFITNDIQRWFAVRINPNFCQSAGFALRLRSR